MTTIHPWLKSHQEEIFQLGKELFDTPELGFKEYQTRDLILKFLHEHQFTNIERYGETGIIVTIGQGKPVIGLLAELDAIPTPGHPQADPDTGAAHSCGHSTQCAIMLAALCALKEEIQDKQGTIKLFFTPAEEFTDIDFREAYIKSGKAKYYSGKVNMLMDGVFDDVDVFIHCHAMGEYRTHHYAIGSTLAGFTYKRITFKGQAAHAAVNPDQGINALNIFALFQSAVGMLRETFVDEDKNRIHGIVLKGGSTVNSIPDEVIYECYVRSFNSEQILILSDKVDHIAKHCALALGGDVEIKNLPGDLPFYQDENLNRVIYRNLLKHTNEEDILTTEKSVAAGDIGDLGSFKPTIQFGYTGFTGVCHGKTMAVQDEEMVYQIPADIVIDSVLDLLNHPEEVDDIKNKFQPRFTKDEYIKHLEG